MKISSITCCHSAKKGRGSGPLASLMGSRILFDLRFRSIWSILEAPNKELSCRASFLTLDKRILIEESLVLGYLLARWACNSLRLTE